MPWQFLKLASVCLHHGGYDGADGVCVCGDYPTPQTSTYIGTLVSRETATFPPWLKQKENKTKYSNKVPQEDIQKRKMLSQISM